MKKTLTLFITVLIAGFIQAQTTHNISVQSNSFTPSNLTIEVGDEVVWTNIGGSHNVNGTLATYPNNPEGFGNNVGSGWTFSHTFTLPGTYDYRCDPHVNLGMIGVITVNESANNVEDLSITNFTIYPNPNNGQFSILNEGVNGNYLIEFFDLTGKVVYSEQIQMNSNERTVINSRDVNTGIYLVKMTNTDENYQRTLRMVIK